MLVRGGDGDQDEHAVEMLSACGPVLTERGRGFQGATAVGEAHARVSLRFKVCVVAITLLSWHRSCNPKLELHARFGNMDTNTAFTPGSLPFTGAGGRLNKYIDDAIGLRSTSMVCKSEEGQSRQ